jgi:hypothetical protein
VVLGSFKTSVDKIDGGGGNEEHEARRAGRLIGGQEKGICRNDVSTANRRHGPCTRRAGTLQPPDRHARPLVRARFGLKSRKSLEISDADKKPFARRADLLSIWTDLLSVWTDFLSVWTDFLSIWADLLSVWTDLLSIWTDLVSVGADLVSEGRDLVSVGPDLVSVGRDLVSVGSDLVSVWTDLVSVRADLAAAGAAV